MFFSSDKKYEKINLNSGVTGYHTLLSTKMEIRGQNLEAIFRHSTMLLKTVTLKNWSIELYTER